MFSSLSTGVSTVPAAVSLGAAHLNALMYAIGEIERSAYFCSHVALDECVGTYTGSVARANKTNSSGYMTYALADRWCPAFKTCGTSGDASSGTSKVNIEMFALYNAMQQDIRNKSCSRLAARKDRITNLISVPFVQGTLQNAFLVNFTSATDATRVELATLAASVLPLVHYCSPAHAAVIYRNVKVGSTGTSFAEIKRALEWTYHCLGIRCSDVGKLDETTAMPYYDAEPCVDCTRRGVRCTRRSQCCGGPTVSACDGPPGQTICKGCVKATRRCARMSQCCPGLRCKARKCLR